jgi:hypothetical protein
MQVVTFISEEEWHDLIATLDNLKREVGSIARQFAQSPAAVPAPTSPERILTVREAANYMRLKPEGVRNARRSGRLAGLRLNEKEWGFRLSELDRYLSRYNRRPLDDSLPPLSRY